MIPSNANTNPPPFLAAGGVVPSIGFTFTTNVKTGSNPSTSAPAPTTTQLLHGQSVESRITAMKISEAPAISLRFAINVAAPANRLPTELVVKTLTSGAWSYWWELVALSHICQHWRNIALGTPQLWADAVHSVFLGHYRWRWIRAHRRSLPTLLERSVPCPLRVNFRSINIDKPDDDYLAFVSHLSRLTHLSIQNMNIDDFTNFVNVVGPCVRNLESLNIPLVETGGVSDRIDINKLRFWHNTDFPRLHTLSVPAYCFLKAIAVASLRNVVLWDRARSYDSFLDALDRCAHGLQSLALNNWLEPWCESRTPSSATPTVQLSNLRHFSVSISSRAQSSEPLTFLFAALSLPPDVTIHLDWKYYPVILHRLLPKDLVGLQAPPFFDSMYLHLSPRSDPATLFCYANDMERLVVQEWPLFGDPDPTVWRGRRHFNEFLYEHQYTTVTQLALDFDMERPGGYSQFVSADLVQRYVSAFPRLRRLDLFGNEIGNIQLSVAETFLSLPEPEGAQGAPGKTLGYVYKIANLNSENRAKHIGNVCTELSDLERVLKAHQSMGGVRLHRLELCVAYGVHDPSPQTYPYAHRFPPEKELTACVASAYFQRFEALVDEVVFVGHVERRGLDPGHRLLPSKGLQLVPEGSPCSTGGKQSTTRSRLAPPLRKRQKN